jgi:hypothetical protein
MASTVGPGSASSRQAASTGYVQDPAGYGWVVFAGSMLAIVGTLNFIYGIAAVSDSKFYAHNVTYVISSLNTWGWVMLCIGVVQVVSAFGIWGQVAGARWVGVLSAAVNAIIQMLVIPAYPFLALSLFAIDILVIYGLIAHGARARADA